jgi:Short C-terminal domain
MDMGIFWTVMIVGLVIGLAVKASQGDARGKAKDVYQTSLQELTNNPTNPELRQRTLELGRAYSRLTRNSRGVTIFDEVALSNDINAAAGGTMAIAPPRESRPSIAAPTMEDRLAQLARLKDQGLISEAEYTAKRQKVLDEV